MRITLEQTTKIVSLVTPTGTVPARIWEGTTAGGIPIHCFVTRVCVHKDEDHAEFERELQEARAPTRLVDDTYPARLVL
jgi:hypothetical protein